MKILIHKRYIDKIDYLYHAYPKGLMYVDKGNIQRDIPQHHYRFEKHEPIVLLLGASHIPIDLEKEKFIDLKDTDIIVKQ